MQELIQNMPQTGHRIRSVEQGGQGNVDAALTYLVETDEKPVTFVYAPGTGETERLGQHEPVDVRIENGRTAAPEATLDREGFALVQSDTAVADFYDEAEVEAVYYPEIEALVKKATGASRVHIFDHTRRIDVGPGKEAEGRRAPVRLVHNDYTAGSGPQRVRDLFAADEAERLLAGRFAVINVWRPIRGPVRTAPLAIADAQSIPPKDLVATDLIYPDRTGEIYEVTHSAGHRWFYFPEMESDEAVLIKSYDSAEDGRARFAPHTAFDDPNSPDDAEPRESIEVRTLAFFGPEAT
ncbi:MAG: hypothetical protein MI920_29145 [Kiloniellales bacterium]|nr:hypothetical protein [Kiloniellales bacterium]